jgi:dTDP-glucose 4,6-dehydratase
MKDADNGEAYHISSREMIPISSIVGHICTRLGTTFEKAVEITAERPGKDAAYMLDSGKIRRLGWEDTVSLDTGIDEVIALVTEAPVEYEHRA